MFSGNNDVKEKVLWILDFRYCSYLKMVLEQLSIFPH